MDTIPLLLALLLGLLGLFIFFKLFFIKGWLKLWLRAFAAVSVLLFSLSALMLALDLFSYKAYHDEQELAKISVHRLEEQHFKLILHQPQQMPLHFDIRGDMWQLDGRLLLWDKAWQVLGLENQYRLERVSGRYQSVADEYNKPRSVFSLVGLDSELSASSMVRWARLALEYWGDVYAWVPGANAVFGASTYLPMVDGARYLVLITEGGIRVKAENKLAQEAVASWRFN